MTISECNELILHKNNLNEELPGFIKKYKEEEDSYIKNLLFEKILKSCENVIYKSVHKIKFLPPITFDELTVQAYEFFYNCIEYDYDYSKNCKKIVNYLITYISNRLIIYVKESQNTIRIPHNALKHNYYEINKSYESGNTTFNLLIEDGFSKTEICDYFNFRMLLKNNLDIFDAGVECESNFESFNFINEYIDEYNDLYDALKKLSEKELDFFIKTYLYGCTTKEIGDSVGCSKQRISKINKNTIRKLQNYLE